MNFTGLYHSSNYTAYFVADLDREGKNLLMEDGSVVAVDFKTDREIFVLDEGFEPLVDAFN